MELSIRELNELIYCIGIARMHGQLLGTTVADNLEVALRDELDKRLEMDLSTKSHYVSNEEADEDFFSTLQQDEQRYEASHMTTSFPITNPFTSEYKPKGVTQSILDFVQLQGDATYTEMQNFYRKEFGSNSFSHILKSLTIPYKNRPTRRYLSKMSNGNYEVRLANPSNWVVVENDFIKWIRSNTK